jgi:hypothetical protein
MHTTMYHLMSTEYSLNKVKTRFGVISIPALVPGGLSRARGRRLQLRWGSQTFARLEYKNSIKKCRSSKYNCDVLHDGSIRCLTASLCFDRKQFILFCFGYHTFTAYIRLRRMEFPKGLRHEHCHQRARICHH